MFQQPDEVHHVSESPKSAYQLGYERGYAWAQARRESILQYIGITTSVAGLLIVVVATGIYGFGWQNTFSYVISYPLPMPAATVNSDPIWYTDYMQQINYVKAVHSYQQGNKDTKEPTSSQIHAGPYAMDTLITRHVIHDVAREYDISVSESEMETRFQSTYTGQNVRARMAEESGVSHEMLRQHVRTDLLRYKLEQKLEQDGMLAENQRPGDWIGQRVRETRITYWLPQLGM